jgi:AcrR family transcriptional regulator
MASSLSDRGAARRDAVLRIARELLVAEGYDQFVLRRVAAAARMTLGNLQYYFATRDDLLEAVIRAEFEHDIAAVRRAATLDGLAEASRALVKNWTTGAGAVFATMWLLAYHQERFGRLNREIYETFYSELGALIRRESADVTEPEVRLRVRLITSVLDGVVLQIHADPAKSRDLTNRAAALVASIATGG